MLRVLLLIMLSSFSCEAHAAQILNVINPDTDLLTASISNYDSNRVRISGGYISSAAGPNNGVVSIETEDKQGQVFIRVNNSSKPFTLFLTSEAGKNYSVLLKPRAMPGQSIIIKPRFEVKHSNQRPIGTTQRVSRIKRIIKSIANDDIPTHCELKEKSITVPWWDKTLFQLFQQLDCGDWIADKYLLTNQNKSELTITEQEFFHDGVIAVSIEHPYLSGVISIKSHESTPIWLIRDKHHER